MTESDLNIKVVTFTHRPELYRIAAAMMDDLPYPKIALHEYPGSNVNGAFDMALAVGADWLIHIDEDAFVFAPERIPRLVNYMANNGFALCGVPDGGVVEHRRHNPVVCNPFFSIVNVKLILERAKDTSSTQNTQWDESYGAYTAPFVGRDGKQFAYDHFESWYGAYFWLCKQGLRVLYLDAAAWEGEPEGLSTLVKDHTGEFFLLHTWFAREYDGKHRARIDRAIQHALELWAKHRAASVTDSG